LGKLLLKKAQAQDSSIFVDVGLLKGMSVMAFKQRFISVLDYAETNLFIIGLLGSIGFPLYFYVWNYLFPQPYENLGLRLFCSLLFAPWLFYKRFFYKYKDFFAVYFLLSIFICVPVFFSFMLLKNEFSVIWVMSFMAALSLLVVVVYDWLLVCAMTALGFALAYLLILVSDGAISLQSFRPEYISIYLIALISGMIANHRHKVGEFRSKIRFTKSLAGAITHEMRNPMTQIHGNLYLIKELQKQIPYLNGAKPIVAQHINNAQRVIQSGLQVIDMTMDAIKDKPINQDSFKLLFAQALAKEAVKDYAYADTGQLQKMSIRGEDFKFMAKPVMVKYVLYNLIQNALFYIKSLPDARIVISLIPNIDGVNRIEVRNTGSGIAPEVIPKLFDSFHISDEQGGTGLGLSYCKRIMTALGGGIHCHSELGQYTAFTLFFPMVSAQQIIAEREQVPRVEKLPKPVTTPLSLVGKTVLIVEDERISRMIVKVILEKQGIQCLEAENGKKALDLFLANHCDLILTDMQMPVMGGLELIRAVRERERRTNDIHVPIIALTAEEGDLADTAIEFGPNDYLSKPVSVKSLVPKLRRLLAG